MNWVRRQGGRSASKYAVGVDTSVASAAAIDDRRSAGILLLRSLILVVLLWLLRALAGARPIMPGENISDPLLFPTEDVLVGVTTAAFALVAFAGRWRAQQPRFFTAAEALVVGGLTLWPDLNLRLRLAIGDAVPFNYRIYAAIWLAGAVVELISGRPERSAHGQS